MIGHMFSETGIVFPKYKKNLINLHNKLILNVIFSLSEQKPHSIIHSTLVYNIYVAILVCSV